MSVLRSIANIGGGFTGSTITAMQVDHALRAFEQGGVQVDSLTLKVVEGHLTTRRIGPGGPYSHGSDIFLLNQPAYAMSPFESDPDHFTKWLIQQGDYTQDSFAPRALYGLYLETAFHDAVVKTDGTPVNVEYASMRVENVVMRSGSFGLVDGNGQGVEANAVVVADGHQRSSLLRGLSDHERYFHDPYNIEAVADAVKQFPKRVGIIGTSQSMIDVLTVLDHVGFQGDIYCFSRNLVMPWKLDAGALRRKEGQNCRLKYLTEANIKKQSDRSYENFGRLLAAEISAAKDSDFNAAQVVLAVLDAWDDLKGFMSEGDQRAFRGKLAAIYGNPTSPKKFEMLTDFQETGQLSTIRMAISPDKVHAHDGGIDITDGSKHHRVSVLFNAANVARSVYDRGGKRILSPVLRSLEEQKALRFSEKFKGAVEEGQQLRNGLWVGGPMTRTGKWGVETFRPNNAVVAKQSTGYALGL